MEGNIDNNNGVIEENKDIQEYEYNFISVPWDDRTKKSKLLVIFVLNAIFIITIALVINNFITHFKKFTPVSSSVSEIKCNLVKVDEYRYAARIHLVSTQELICVGAVIRDNSVLANEVCIKSGSVRLYIGSPTDYYCKKGFPVDSVEFIPHSGVISKNLVVLSTYEKMAYCKKVIRIGVKLDWQSKAYIIGRPVRGEKLLSRQPVYLAHLDNYTHNPILNRNVQYKNVICVRYLSHCPVRAGDLLIQGNRLFGLATTSSILKDYNTVACFANISYVYRELRELNVDVDCN